MCWVHDQGWLDSKSQFSPSLMLQHDRAGDPAQHTLSYRHLQAQKYYSVQLWQLDQAQSKSSVSVDLLLAEKALTITIVYL